MTLQLVLGYDRRLHAEIAVIWEDGSTTLKDLPAHGKLLLHFDELSPDALHVSAPKPP